MDRVFELYVADKDLHTRSTKLTLPASPYEIADVLEQVGSEKADELYFEVEESHRGEYLVDMLENSITLRELNILAWRIAEMDEGQEAILEGLVKMESRKQGTGRLPYLKLLQLTENTDCCHWVPQARNDSQLGRFYAENGFVEGIDDLPDKLFEMLDFEKIGREMRLAEGGIFTEDSGYVVRHTEMREPEKVPNLDLQKPLYTIAMEIRKAGEENGPWLTIELPLMEGKLEEFQKRFPREEYAYSCIDCAIPFFGEYISGGDAGLQEINGLARIMDFALARDELAKYKAILLATGCRDVRLAAELGRQRSMEEYRFLPYQNENGPEEYAAGWLKKKLGRDAALVPDLGLEELGRRLMERDHVTETNYGPIQRIDGQPIQRFDLERTPGFQMGGMGGM